jgi:hypothetical protein
MVLKKGDRKKAGEGSDKDSVGEALIGGIKRVESLDTKEAGITQNKGEPRGEKIKRLGRRKEVVELTSEERKSIAIQLGFL